MINRGVLIVRPKQPFLDWAAGLDDSGVLPDVEGEHLKTFREWFAIELHSVIEDLCDYEIIKEDDGPE